MLDSLAYKISAWNRRRKWSLFQDTMSFDRNTKILDAGFTDIEYSDTDNFLEKNYPYQHNITALGIDKSTTFYTRYPKIKVIQYDGSVFPFDDDAFDIVWSNAVIEHVGNKDKQTYFLKELCRVGTHVYMTTPNKFFPFEVHTRIPLLHIIFSKKCFDTFLRMIGKSWATGDYLHLLSKRDIVSMLKKIPGIEYRIYKNKLLGFTLDFVIMIDKHI